LICSTFEKSITVAKVFLHYNSIVSHDRMRHNEQVSMDKLRHLEYAVA